MAAKLGKALFPSPGNQRAGDGLVSSTHRAENSSKVSSWCSERRRADVLKELDGRLATARPARAAKGCGRAATRLARRKLEGPRAATRSREADIFFLLNEDKNKIPSRDES